MIVIFHTADWHLGHNKTPTEYIIKNLKKYLLSKLKQYPNSVLFIAGDIFDSSISVNSKDFGYILEFFIELFNLLKQKNIVLRVIRGTYSHDKDQLNFLLYLHKFFPELNLKLINEITKENLLGYKILYLPDDLPYESEEQILNNFVIDDNIDIVVGHGTWDFVEFSKYLKNYVVYNKLKDYVKYFCLFGHYHVPGIKDHKVIYSGSFDRLAFGEEHPKGYFIIKINNKITTEFIENYDALPYITIDLINKKYTSNMLNNLQKYNKFPLGYIRIIHDNNLSDITKYQIKSDITKILPNFKITFLKRSQQQEDLNVDVNNEYYPVLTFEELHNIIPNTKLLYKKSIITQDNIKDWFLNKLQEDTDIDTTKINMTTLEEVIEEIKNL